MAKTFSLIYLLSILLFTGSGYHRALSIERQASINELGKIMILEYHQIEDKQDRPKGPSIEDRWSRSVENFKRDLERFYQSGYRLMSLNDYIDGKIDIPRGKSPLILTFDDSSPGQFRSIERGGKLEVDPNCAVGILEDFNKSHADFGHKATFFVLPAAKQPHKLFGQPEYEKRKLQHLVEHGYEIGNHTLWHANLGKYDETTVKKQLALAVKSIRELVPGYRIRSLALPFGVYPKDLDLAVRGKYDGVEYYNEAILRVSGGPAYSPYHRSCDLLHLPRIQATTQELNYWLKYFERNAEERFISDGKPEVITFSPDKEKFFNKSKFRNLHVEMTKTNFDNVQVQTHSK